MNHKPIILFALSLAMLNCFSQQEPATDIQNITKVTFLSPGASYELRIGKFQSLYGHAFLKTSGSVGYSSTFGFDASYRIDPAVAAQYRYYYNVKKRALKGKPTANNNLNYIAGVYDILFSKVQPPNGFYFEEKSRRIVNELGIVWGMQRNYKSYFSLDLNLGFGYWFAKGTTDDNMGNLISEKVSTPTTLVNMHLGFWLNKEIKLQP